MLAELKKARFPVETGILIAFCFFLPLIEFWKNAALLAYLSAWALNRARARDFGGPWRAADTLAALWLGGAYLSAAFAGLGGTALGKTGDVAASTLLFWSVLRAGYGERERLWLLGSLVASTLVGLAQGYWSWLSGAGRSGTLQLHSVGHVNHTAIYLAIMLGVCASWLFARWRTWGAGRRAAGAAVVACVFGALVSTVSRGAIGAGALLVLALAAAWWPRWKAPLVASLASIAIVAALLIGFGAAVVQKQERNMSDDNVLAFRDSVWRLGLAAWAEYPWFGVGKDNYSRITLEQVREWRTARGEDFDAQRYLRSPHAHNLYVNTLVERGALGLATLLLVVLGTLAALLRHRPRPEEADVAWLSWGAAAGAWIATCGIGLVNTTLHHEHGMLTVLLMALWLSTLRPPRAS